MGFLVKNLFVLLLCFIFLIAHAISQPILFVLIIAEAFIYIHLSLYGPFQIFLS